MYLKQISLGVYLALILLVAVLTRNPLLTIVAALMLALAPLVMAALVGVVWAVVVAVAPVPKVPLSYNLRNLSVRWKTTLMTGLAFTLVTALLAVMLAFVNGMNRLTESSGQPGNVIVLSDGATDEVMSKLPPGASVERLPHNVKQKVLHAADGKTYLATKEVYVIVSQPLQRVSGLGATRRLTQMRGLDDPEIASQVHSVTLVKGRWFKSTGEPEIVLGEGIAHDIAKDRGVAAIEPGTDEVELGPQRWKVVGIMKTAGTTFDSEIWASDRALATKTFGRENSYTSYAIRTASADDARFVAKEIKNWRAEWSFDAFPEPEYYAKFNLMTRIFMAAIIVVAVVMAAGGALGITNTMFAAISQRSKDIGVLRLLGFTRAQVLTSFLLESLVIALIGGLLGCVLGYLANGWTATSMLQSGMGGGRSVVLTLIVDLPTMAICLGFSLLMGAVGGLIPALTATRLRPLESLR
jgi:ABC-type lipoprotein release transport system permease subunit